MSLYTSRTAYPLRSQMMHLTLMSLLAFGVALAIDFTYTRWVVCVSERRRTAACFYSSVLPLLGSLSLIVFLVSWFSTIPAPLGHAAGTGAAMRGTNVYRPTKTTSLKPALAKTPS